MILSRGEMCVCDIEAATRFTQTKTSRHLSYLRRVGLVRARRDGLWMHYSVIMPKQPEAQMLLSCVSKILENNRTLRVDLERDARWRDKKSCCLMGGKKIQGGCNE